MGGAPVRAERSVEFVSARRIKLGLDRIGDDRSNHTASWDRLDPVSVDRDIRSNFVFVLCPDGSCPLARGWRTLDSRPGGGDSLAAGVIEGEQTWLMTRGSRPGLDSGSRCPNGWLGCSSGGPDVGLVSHWSLWPGMWLCTNSQPTTSYRGWAAFSQVASAHSYLFPALTSVTLSRQSTESSRRQWAWLLLGLCSS